MQGFRGLGALGGFLNLWQKALQAASRPKVGLGRVWVSRTAALCLPYTKP